MKSLLLFLTLPVAVFAYSGPDLRGTLAAGQIATSIFLYAAEHDGKIDIPYSEIPNVASEVKSYSADGTFAFPSHARYSSRKVDPVPVVYFSMGNMVAVGFGDGSHRYYEVEDRPAWVRFRSGLSAWEWTIVLSLFTNLVAFLYFGGNWIQKKLK